MLHTYWVGDAMGIFKKHYRMNAKIALNIRIPPFWTDSDMIRDYHTYVFAAKKHLFENPVSVRTDFIIHLEGLRLQAFQNLSLNQKQESQR